ncbi:ABC transporter [Geothrix limicola]|uniref:ABC transporter n=1 Tax=Geothrix limicola TaxID=2927978 RepID=A0ABQ5QDP5_9BACT|nr:ABC transporter ATP-binding protein [Geothrix limicola]GLH72260.1 ABC transporter [Geothrix limicola]
MSERAEGLWAQVSQTLPIPLEATLACAPGEVLALVGPSGSGKSTLLRTLAGLVRPASGLIRCQGEIWFDGERHLDLSPRQRRVGFVFQNYGLFPHLTALENVMEAVDRGSVPERRARSRQWLERVHLQGLESRKPHQMSGGQQQRVAMARALARNPDLLLMDEPFSAVDRVTREKLYLELADLLQGLSIPMILVTHDLDEAAMLASRMVLLSRGRTLQSGTPDEVMLKPNSTEVARLLGNRNIFSAVVRRQDAVTGETVLDWEGEEILALVADPLSLGERVSWVIAPGDVSYRYPGTPEDRPGHTYLGGTISTLVRFGDTARVVLALPGAAERTLHLTASRQMVQRSNLAAGHPIRIALPATKIQVFREEGAGSKGRHA